MWLDNVFWNNSVQSYLIAAALAAAALILGWILSALLRRWVVRGHRATEGRIDDLVAGVGHRLVMVAVFLAGLHAAFRVLVLPEWLTSALWPVFVVLWTLLGAVFVGRLLNGFIVHYLQRHARQGDGLLDAQFGPILRSVINVVVWIVAGLFALGNLGFNIGSILAGLGIGGLALAMGSKDLLANFFGAFTILVQGPFRVGEAISYQGHSGAVERVGLRSTEIRTWDGHLVSVPNSLATTSVVENISRRPSFRVLFQLGLETGTSKDKCTEAVELIKRAIEAEPGTRAGPLVHFLEFSESALVFQVLYHIEDQKRILDVRHAVNSRIHQALEEAGIALAHRTITVKRA